MKKNLISIVLTLYNKAPYIEDTIFSIFKQTYINRELIILDDCSSDGSLQIAKSFCEKLGIINKCNIIKNDRNLGLNMNTLNGIKLCKGEYIALADADDIWVRNKLERNINFCKKHDLDLCYSDLSTIDENSKIKNISFNNIYHIGENSGQWKKAITKGLCVTSSMLFKHTLAEKILDFQIPHGIYQDRRIGILSTVLQYKIGFINEPLVYYRIMPGNMSYNNGGSTNIDILDRRIKIIQSENTCCSYIIDKKIYINSGQKKRCSDRIYINNL